MSSMCNITGRLYGTPKTNFERGLPAGKTPFAAFTVGSYNWREKQNDFFDCVSFGGQAETLMKYFHPKRAISVNGRLVINKYKNKAGDEKKNVQIVVTNIDFPTDGEGVPTMESVHRSLEASQAHQEKNPPPPALDEDPGDLPF